MKKEVGCIFFRLELCKNIVKLFHTLKINIVLQNELFLISRKIGYTDCRCVWLSLITR